MPVIFLTGMSGVGKSTVVRELRRRGHAAVDTDDEPGYVEDVDVPGQRDPEPLWREDAVAALLDAHEGSTLFLAGTVANQGRFSARFAEVVLLSVPRDVLLDRLATRTTNTFGRSPKERDRVLRDLDDVEPLLRASATVELDTRRPLAEVVAELERLAGVTPAHSPG